MTDQYRFPGWQTRLLASAIVLSIAWAGAGLITSLPRTASLFDHSYAPLDERAIPQARQVHAAAGGGRRTNGQPDVSAETTGQAGCD